MKKTRLLWFVCPVIALIAEITPYGAILNFWNPEGKPFRETFSYFDLTPFGYANFAPLITAILTCILLIITIIFAIKPKRKTAKIIAVLSAVAFAVSLMPLLYGILFFSPVGAVISIALLVNSLAAFMRCRRC